MQTHPSKAAVAQSAEGWEASTGKKKKEADKSLEKVKMAEVKCCPGNVEHTQIYLHRKTMLICNKERMNA